MENKISEHKHINGSVTMHYIFHPTEQDFDKTFSEYSLRVQMKYFSSFGIKFQTKGMTSIGPCECSFTVNSAE